MSPGAFTIGYEVPSGTRFDVPLQHTAVYGLTRKAGKTTALEGMISRVGTTALVFRCGKNDLPFEGAHRIRAFFRERYDWRYVERLLWSFLEEKSKVYRTLVMRATQGATSLADVHARIVKAGKTARRSWDQDLLFQLDHFFREILPALASLRLATDLELELGRVNLIDLEGQSKTVQALLIASALDRLMARPPEGGCVVVLPEARNFVPSDTRTPATKSADDFVREGAKLGLYLWIDSQSLTGVDQQVVRNFGLSLHGHQTSDIEIRRIVKAIDHGIESKDVKRLGLGQFLVEDQDGVRVVYVTPAWLPAEVAVLVAKGTVSAEEAARRYKHTPEINVDEKERTEYDEKIAGLEHNVRQLNERNIALEQRAKDAERRAEANAKAAAASAVARVGAAPKPTEFEALAGESEDLERIRTDLHVQVETPNLTVHVREVRIDAQGDELRGIIAQLLVSGFFAKAVMPVDVAKEIVARGGKDYRTNGGQRKRLHTELVWFAGSGFLRRGGPRFEVVTDALTRIRVDRLGDA
ncbi:MAG: hypothetical protein L3K00_03205 [Thermoplasmata archaeon]|nr:hypothetical protein [Thermoplasmata archaeon]